MRSSSIIPKALTLKKNFSWAFIGNILNVFSQYIILVLITKVGGIVEAGYFSLGLAICSPLFAFTNFALRDAISIDVTDKFKFQDYFALRICMGLVSFGIIAFIVFMIEKPIFAKQIICLVFSFKLLESFSDIIYGLFQKNERLDFNGKSLILKALTSIVIVSIIIIINQSILQSLFAISIIYFLVLIFYDFKSIKIFIADFSLLSINKSILLKKFKEMVLIYMPLSLTFTIIMLNINIPRFMVDYMLGSFELGIFAGLIYFTVAGRVIIKSLSAASMPRMAKYYNEGNVTKLKALLTKLVLFAFGVGVLGLFIAIIFGKFLLTNLYTEKFTPYVYLFVILMAAGIFRYIGAFFMYSLIAFNKFKIQLSIIIFILFTSIILNYYSIQYFDINGVGYSEFLIALIQFCVSGAFVVYYLSKMKTSWIKN